MPLLVSVPIGIVTFALFYSVFGVNYSAAWRMREVWVCELWLGFIIYPSFPSQRGAWGNSWRLIIYGIIIPMIVRRMGCRTLWIMCSVPPKRGDGNQGGTIGGTKKRRVDPFFNDYYVIIYSIRWKLVKPWQFLPKEILDVDAACVSAPCQGKRRERSSEINHADRSDEILRSLHRAARQFADHTVLTTMLIDIRNDNNQIVSRIVLFIRDFLQSWQSTQNNSDVVLK